MSNPPNSTNPTIIANAPKSEPKREDGRPADSKGRDQQQQGQDKRPEQQQGSPTDTKQPGGEAYHKP